jgi:hypothetical protein
MFYACAVRRGWRVSADEYLFGDDRRWRRRRQSRRLRRQVWLVAFAVAGFARIGSSGRSGGNVERADVGGHRRRRAA